MADKGIPFDVPTRANLLQGQRLIDEQLREKSARDAKLSPLDKAYAALEAARTFGSGILATVGSLPTRAIKGEDAAQEYINQRMYIPASEKAMDYVGNVGDFLEQLETKYKLPPVLPEAVALQNVMGPAAKQATKQAVKTAKPVVGQALEDYMFKRGLALPATVYHGSPHKFDKFDASKIGTGEGAQSYGHGLYLAESPEVARGYKDKLQGGVLGEKTASFLESKLSKSNPELFTTAIKPQVLDTISANAGKSPAEMSSALNRLADNFEKQGFDWQLAAVPNVRELAKNKQLLSDISQNVAGSFYKVDLPDETIAKMLDWDKPLSEQAPGVRDVLEKLQQTQQVFTTRQAPVKGMVEVVAPTGEGMGFYKPNEVEEAIQNLTAGFMRNAGGRPLEGGEIVERLERALGRPEAASVLKGSGIPGIRYLDADSRAAGQGTSNFVVFPGEENALTILERNQQPIKKESTRIADNPDTMMMEVEDQKFVGGGIAKAAKTAAKSAVATRELEKQAVLRAEAATKSAAKQALMPQYNEAVKGQTQKQKPLSFEQWKAINYPEGTQGLQNAPQKQTFKYPQEEAMRLAQQRAALPIEQGGLGLPANNTPEQRAKAMGWNNDVYHATPNDFLKFDLKKAGEGTTITKGEKAVFSSSKPSVANEFVAGPYYNNNGVVDRFYPSGSNIMPLKIRSDGSSIYDMFGRGYEENFVEQAIKDAKKSKDDTVVFRKMRDPGFTTIGPGELSAIVASLKPDNIRSRFAAFDPFRKTAATAAAMGVAAPDLLAEENKASGGSVNLDAMYMAVNDAKFRRK
jgi:hypothetical protein